MNREISTLAILFAACSTGCTRTAYEASRHARHLFAKEETRILKLRDLVNSGGPDDSGAQALADSIGLRGIGVGSGEYKGLISFDVSASGTAFAGESVALIYASDLEQELISHHMKDSRVRWFALAPDWWVQVAR